MRHVDAAIKLLDSSTNSYPDHPFQHIHNKMFDDTTLSLRPTLPHASYNKKICCQISMTKTSQQIQGRPSNSQESAANKKKTIKEASNKARCGRPTKKILKQTKNSRQSSPGQSLSQESSQNCIIEAGIQIIHKYIDFFQEINEKKGFVFKKKEREQFSKCFPHLRFTEESEWSRQMELEKIRDICQRYKCDSEALRGLMLQSSAIFAREFTFQHYLILLKVYNIVTEGMSPEKQRDELANLARKINENLDDQFLFFSLVYKAQIKTRYSRPEIKPYEMLIKGISTIIKECIIKPNNRDDLLAHDQ